MLARLVLIGLAVLSFSVGAYAEGLKNINDEKPAARFKVSGPEWPANVGEAIVCLWKDDKIAPVSITVDDNSAPDVSWRLEMGDKYGIKITWFLISGNVGKPYGGPWELWKSVLAKGHDVQSHTHTHLHTEIPGWKDIEWEYTEAQKTIEANLPGHKVTFLAYPGGGNAKLNDRGIAVKYHAGGRGTTGMLVPPNVIDYMNIRAITETAFANPKSPWADMQRVLDPKDKVYRAWSVLIYHNVSDKNVPERPMFKFIANNQDKIWNALFAEASKYGQQRDTATLKVDEKSDAKIAFTLTDKMDDTWFDYPLTVKVRVPDGWSGVVAQQTNKPVEAKLVENQGKKYALVQAIPDRGVVTITAK